MINILMWIGILTLAILIITWISARVNRIKVLDYFRFYGSELLILYVFTVIIIVYIGVSGGI